MESKDAERTDGGKTTAKPADRRRMGNTNTTHGKVRTGTTAGTETGKKDRSFDATYNSEKNESTSTFGKGTGVLGLLGAVAGGALLFRGIKGQWPFGGASTSTPKKVDLSTRQTIRKSREELYAYWRNLENLPNFMSHLKEVKELDTKRSSWTAKIPGGLGTVEWDAEIVRERKNHIIAWRSLPDAEIENAGEVRFETAPGGRGTIVETTISYRPPAGELGNYAAKLFNPTFEKTVRKDLQEFKKFMEKGGRPKRKSTPSMKV